MRPCYPEQEKSALEVIRLSLQLLPRDALIGLDLPSTFQIDRATLATICTQQRCLRTLGLGPVIDGYLAPISDPTSWLRELVYLDTPHMVCGRHDIDFWSSILRNCPKLKCLGIRASAYCNQDGQEPQAERPPLEDTAGGPGALFGGLFGHLSESNVHERLELKELWLDRIDLRYSQDTLLKRIRFDKLKELHLLECRGADTILCHLTTLAKTEGCALRLLWYDAAQTDFTSVQALEACLQATHGLEALKINFWTPGDCVGVKCLSSHFSTLKDLYISRGRNSKIDARKHWVMSLSELQMLSKNCPNLRQLAVAAPPTSLQDVAAAISGDYGMFMSEVGKLDNLQILRILTWPSANAVGSTQEGKQILYKSQLGCFASMIVQHIS